MQFEGYEIFMTEMQSGLSIYCNELAEQVGVSCETIHKIIRQIKKEIPLKAFEAIYTETDVTFKTKNEIRKDKVYIIDAGGIKEILRRLSPRRFTSSSANLLTSGEIQDGYEYAVNCGEEKYALVLKQGQPVVSSLDVAKAFGKQHFHVLRDIEQILQDLPPDFRESNFGFSKYESKSGKNTIKELPLYNLSRDGFMLLIMRFTGKPAMQIKIHFLKAFHEMEKLLKAYQEKQHPHLPDRIEWRIENQSILYVNTMPVLPESMIPNLLEMSEYAWAFCKQEAENKLMGGIDYFRFGGHDADAIRKNIANCPFLCLAKKDALVRLWSFSGVKKVYENHKLYSQYKLERLHDMYFGAVNQ